jgi:Rieske Fe-S protein
MTSSRPRSVITRRHFLSALTRTTAGLVLLPRFSGQSSRSSSSQSAGGWIDLGSFAGLAPGEPVPFPITRLPDSSSSGARTGVAYAVTLDGQSVRVLSNICTHGGCRIHWDPAQGAFACPCHESRFAADGRVLAGLAPRPLDEFEARVRDGRVEIHAA